MGKTRSNNRKLSKSFVILCCRSVKITFTALHLQELRWHAWIAHFSMVVLHSEERPERLNRIKLKNWTNKEKD